NRAHRHRGSSFLAALPIIAAHECDNGLAAIRVAKLFLCLAPPGQEFLRTLNTWSPLNLCTQILPCASSTRPAPSGSTMRLWRSARTHKLLRTSIILWLSSVRLPEIHTIIAR